MSEVAAAAAEKKHRKAKRSRRPPEGFLASVEFHRLIYYVGIPALVALVGVYAYIVVSTTSIGEDATMDAAEIVHSDFTAKAPLPLSTEFNVITHAIDEIDWSDDDGFISRVVESARPVRIRGSPVHSWPASSWDLTAAAAAGLLLNGSRLQSSPVFVLGHERDKGGMLGREEDLPVTYVNVYLKDFLQTVFERDTYMYWTGPASVVEDFMSATAVGPARQSKGPSSIGQWEALRVAESSVAISLDDKALWTPMLWLSHPGVTAQTHYDTQHNFFAHILGRKKFLIFELASELYPYPNIHRSYRQSQVRLEQNSSAHAGGPTPRERFPLSKRLNAIEVSVRPGDLLYIPPFWAHRVESETLSMSISVLSPSSTEVALAEAFWTKVPFGPFESRDNVFRSGAVKLLLYYLVGLGDVLMDLSLETFALDLLHSRYQDIYPSSALRKLKVERKYRCPSTGDEELTKLLEENAQKFYEAALEVATLVNDLKVHRIIKETFYRDYAEQVIRWAVGPDSVPLFLKYCLK